MCPKFKLDKWPYYTGLVMCKFIDFGYFPNNAIKHRWDVKIKMDLTKTEYEGMEWILMPQVRIQWKAPVNKITNLWVPQKAGNFMTS
jgi:hypothetical protein